MSQWALGMWAGVLGMSLAQDILGQAWVLDAVQNHWIDSRITGPLETVALVWLLLRTAKQRRQHVRS